MFTGLPSFIIENFPSLTHDVSVQNMICFAIMNRTAITRPCKSSRAVLKKNSYQENHLFENIEPASSLNIGDFKSHHVNDPAPRSRLVQDDHRPSVIERRTGFLKFPQQKLLLRDPPFGSLSDPDDAESLHGFRIRKLSIAFTGFR